MGTDVAIETADVAMMGEDLRHLPQVLSHARRARRIMVQNIGLSLAIIAILISLAALGVLGLATVVFIHELAEVLVILNAIRAARTQPLPEVTATPPETTAQQRIAAQAPAEEASDSCGRSTRAHPASVSTLTVTTHADADRSDEGGCPCCPLAASDATQCPPPTGPTTGRRLPGRARRGPSRDQRQENADVRDLALAVPDACGERCLEVRADRQVAVFTVSSATCRLVAIDVNGFVNETVRNGADCFDTA
jgi:hypothetical protein